MGEAKYQIQSQLNSGQYWNERRESSSLYTDSLVTP